MALAWSNHRYQLINKIMIKASTCLLLQLTTITMGSPADHRPSIWNQLTQRSDISPNYCQSSVCYDNLGCFEPWPLRYLLPWQLYSVCPVDPSLIGTTFHVFYSFNPSTESLDGIGNITSASRIVFFIHGYKNFYNDSRFIELKDQLLRVVDVVIMVDYSRGADPGIVSRVTDFYNIHQAAANTQVVGRQITLLVDRLIKDKQVSMSNVHVISYSLGCKTAHFMAAYGVERFGWKIGRITGLDPPGILIFGPGRRLDPIDADFVDIIHTTRFKDPWDFNRAGSGKVGLADPIGHVDFYPNGSDENDHEQPGCQGIAWCSHGYALRLFKASFEKCPFPAYPCNSYSSFARGNCNFSDMRLGYWSYKYPGRGKHYLKTSENPLETC